jgi:3'-phosphoadenosine 5'-phosphosulfate sulfotransferase (PAPS reductase)/FAD synthetase
VKTVLQFSGGADSLAALFVKASEWDEITVLWCNTGSAYPDTMMLMDKVRAMVPHFQEVLSNKASWEHLHGTAVDLLPERASILGSLLHKDTPRLYTSFLSCCASNLWAPLERATIALGATRVIRGQRNDERRKTPIMSGHVDRLGITYEFPIEDWTQADVLKYCKDVCPDLLPESYSKGELTGHDCWDCIAYLDENVQRIRNLPPVMRARVQRRLEEYHATLQPDYSALRGLLA